MLPRKHLGSPLRAVDLPPFALCNLNGVVTWRAMADYAFRELTIAGVSKEFMQLVEEQTQRVMLIELSEYEQLAFAVVRNYQQISIGKIHLISPSNIVTAYYHPDTAEHILHTGMATLHAQWLAELAAQPPARDSSHLSVSKYSDKPRITNE